ncbi:phosphotransferase family protein [Penicillium herquei]|nr:phosphotransferase family protein [Penicillium herquei]
MSLSLPYYRDPGQLPGPLPDRNEIDLAAKTLPNLRRTDYDGRLIVIRDKYVVKYGPLVKENEGNALLFVEKQLDIAAPRLYAMYRHQDTLYIIMEYIPGISLETAWPSLTEANKHWIVGKLRSVFDQMRALPSPGFYGGVNAGPVPYRYFWSPEKDPAITGPFQTAEEFAKGIALRSKSRWSDTNCRIFHSDYLGRHLPLALRNYPPGQNTLRRFLIPCRWKLR